jgi:hypothetical protein
MYILFNIANNAQKIADKISAQNAANSNGSVENASQALNKDGNIISNEQSI